MFLSKKTATNFNKPKTQEANKPKRVLGGWNDEEQEKSTTVPKQMPTLNGNQIVNLLDNNKEGSSFSEKPSATIAVSQAAKQDYFDWDTLNEMANINIEKALVQEIVKPSGIRIKQSDAALNDFLKEVKFLEPTFIGSLLLSKIEVNYPFQIKAKALYAIEFLVKKNEDYQKYFKNHAERLKQFPEPEDNVENYRKILKTLMNVIGVQMTSNQEEVKLQFADPGYNNNEASEGSKSAISNFINQNANKKKKNEVNKALVGPGQNKQIAEAKKQVNLLEIDFPSQPNTNQQSLV